MSAIALFSWDEFNTGTKNDVAYCARSGTNHLLILLINDKSQFALKKHQMNQNNNNVKIVQCNKWLL